MAFYGFWKIGKNPLNQASVKKESHINTSFPNNTLKRLFFGLSPDDSARQQCTNIIQAINSQGIKPVTAENLHVTLVFIGMVDGTKEIALLEAAESIPFEKIAITFDQLSYWQKPGVLCLTASETDLKLSALVKRLTALAGRLAIALDDLPFQAHVTLARKAKQPVTLEFAPVTWQSASFCLFESCPSDDGVVYRPLKYWGKK